MACNNKDDAYHEKGPFYPHHGSAATSTSTRKSPKPLISHKHLEKYQSTGMPEKTERKKTRAGHGRVTRCRANRISRECPFPLPNGQSPSFSTPEYRLRGKLRWLFELDRKFSESFPWAFMQMGFTGTHGGHWGEPADHVYYGRSGGTVCQEANYNKLERLACHDFSGGEGDVSEFGSDRDFNGVPEERDEASSLSSYEGPPVTRAPSECSSLSDLSEGRLMGIVEMESWGAEDWRFQAEVLVAECNLLRIEKELAMRRWKQDCAERDRAVRMAEALRSAFQEKFKNVDRIQETESPQDCSKNDPGVLNRRLEKLQEDLKCSEMEFDADDSFAREALKRLEKLQGMSGRHSQSMYDTESPQDCSQNEPGALHTRLEKLQEDLKCSEVAFDVNNSFAREALKRLEQLRSISARRSEMSRYAEDPTEALQGKLENLLLAVHSASSFECDSQDSKASGEKSEDSISSKTEAILANEAVNTTQSLFPKFPKERGCVLETAALRKQLDFLSSELTETKQIAGLIRKEYRSLLSGNRRRRRTSLRHSRVLEASEKELVAEEVQCKAAIRQIATQVQAETEQWSRMQDILHSVKDEMEDLHQARDLWEERALHAEAQLASLQEAVHEWRVRARTAEEEVAALQSEVNKLRNKVERVKHRHALEQSRWLDAESRLKYALASPTVDKNSSDSQAQPQHEQVLDDSVKSNSHEDGPDNCENWQDGNGNMWIIDSLKTSGCNAANLCKLRQKYHTLPDESGTDLCEQQTLFTSSEQNSCVQKAIIGTNKKKIGQGFKENRTTQRCRKAENGRFQFDSSNHEDDEHEICILKSSHLQSSQRLPFREIRNPETFYFE